MRRVVSVALLGFLLCSCSPSDTGSGLVDSDAAPTQVADGGAFTDADQGADQVDSGPLGSDASLACQDAGSLGARDGGAPEPGDAAEPESPDAGTPDAGSTEPPDAGAGDAGSVCIPQCGAGRCGDDQCGGSCGPCEVPSPACLDRYSLRTFASATCRNDLCLLDYSDTTCSTGCENGACLAEACVPDCTGKVCGSDGCHGSCGRCDGADTTRYRCVAAQTLEITYTECLSGQCTQVAEREDCPGGCSNGGCAAATCGPDDSGLVCDSACVAAQTDPLNCGSCGRTCPRLHGTPTCNEGQCGIDCEDGWARCSPTSFVCDVSVLWDSRHCGGCADACSGGQVCARGVCADAPATGELVYALSADAGRDPRGLLLDGDQLYFFVTRSTDSALMTVSVNGEAPEVIATGLENPAWLRQDATSLYWIDRGATETLRTIAKTAREGTPKNLAIPTEPTGLAVDDKGVYWLDTWCDTVGNGGCLAKVGYLSKVDKDGSNKRVIQRGLALSSDLISDGLTLYWEGDNGRSIYSTPVNNPTPAMPPLLVSQGPVWGLMASGGSLYFADGHAVKVVPQTGGTALEVGWGPPAAELLAVDGGELFWAAVRDSWFGTCYPQIAKVSLSTGTVTPLAAVNAGGLAVDSRAIYFSARDEAAIKKIVR